MSKATPGPWQLVDLCAAEGRVHQQLVADGRAAMQLSHDGSPEGQANACLIAATPELRDALAACCYVLANQTNAHAGAGQAYGFARALLARIGGAA